MQVKRATTTTMRQLSMFLFVPRHLNIFRRRYKSSIFFQGLSICCKSLPRRNLFISTVYLARKNDNDTGKGLSLENSMDEVTTTTTTTAGGVATRDTVVIHGDVVYGKLSSKQLRIHFAHQKAFEGGQDTYVDPETDYTVFTRLAHLRRGTCCGSACRHCPYGQVRVKDDALKKKFNSSFYG